MPRESRGCSVDRGPSPPLSKSTIIPSGERMSDKPLPVKAVFVGDGSVGKSAVVKTFCDGAFPRTSPRPQDNGAPFSVTGVAEPIVVRGEPCEVGFWDTASNEEMDRLRPLAYAHTDVFILCFSVVQPDSLGE